MSCHWYYVFKNMFQMELYQLTYQTFLFLKFFRDSNWQWTNHQPYVSYNNISYRQCELQKCRFASKRPFTLFLFNLKKNNDLREENIVRRKYGENYLWREKLANFVSFSFHNNLISDFLQHFNSVTFNFFEKKNVLI